MKNLSEIKPLGKFLDMLEVKPMTDVRRFCDAKSKQKATRAIIILRLGHSKINHKVRKEIYNWILQHPQVIQPPISDDFLKLPIDDHVEPQLVPNVLL